jgi:hypothetical protein
LGQDTDETTCVTLESFSIDFKAKKSLANATAPGKSTLPKMPVFTFHEQTLLNLKYRFPLRS